MANRFVLNETSYHGKGAIQEIATVIETKEVFIMETLQAIKSRRSIRKFKSDMIPKDVLDKIIEAGIYAPTGSCSVPYYYCSY